MAANAADVTIGVTPGRWMQLRPTVAAIGRRKRGQGGRSAEPLLPAAWLATCSGGCPMNANESPTATTAAPAPTVYLVALDDTPSAVMVLDMACALGSTLGGVAELHLVHVVGTASVGLDE